MKRRTKAPLTPPPPIEGARWIQLTKGKWALVDEEDFDRINEFNWCYDGYAIRKTSRNKGFKTVRMHQEVLNFPELEVDHINRNTLDNRKENLREATRSNNMGNTRKHVDNRSGYKGVSWKKRQKKWAATIQGRHLGYFDDPAEAARAYDAAAEKTFGKFARGNDPEN